MIHTNEIIKETIELKNKRKISIAIIGDICLDKYTYINNKINEESVETGLETNSVIEEKYYLGASCNVALNIKTLGYDDIDLFGIVSNDQNYQIVKTLLNKNNIKQENIIIQEHNFKTHVYNKIIKDNKEVQRFDTGNYNKINDKTLDLLLEKIEQNINNYDLVIINEQVLKGFHCDYFVNNLQTIINKNQNINWFIDSRHFIGSYKNVTYKINDKEAKSVINIQNIRKCGIQLQKEFNSNFVITQAKEGALVFENSNIHKVRGIDFINKIDTVGAGDAFLSALSTSYTLNSSLIKSSEIGNIAASSSILTLNQTGHPTFSDILTISENAMWRNNSELAKNSQLSKFIKNSQIEIINNEYISKIPKYPKIAIFDHDGTISVLRQGWEKVMKKMMINTIINNKEIETHKLNRITKKVDNLILKTTGIQTIIQMSFFIDLLKEENLIKQENLLTALEYKEIYIKELKKSMELKLNSLRKGELDVTDFTIKGAVNFLNQLHNNGTKLFLASGTDEEDVKEEAALLGYDYLFENNIYGSVGNIDKDPKQIVMKKIISQIKNDGYKENEIVVFGDGPVEMREAQKHNFFSIGLVSDERQRFGINEEKRERLILAGSDLLIPDFSQIDQLFK